SPDSRTSHAHGSGQPTQTVPHDDDTPGTRVHTCTHAAAVQNVTCHVSADRRVSFLRELEHAVRRAQTMPSLTHTQRLTDRGGALLRLPLPAWLPQDLWPFDTFALSVDGAPIAVSVTGRGPVLLFYTGIGSFVWRDVMLSLASSFRCVTLDPPGIGLSAAGPSDAISLETSARAVDAAMQALEAVDVTLVVHDTGGPPAFAAAARRGHVVNGL